MIAISFWLLIIAVLLLPLVIHLFDPPKLTPNAAVRAIEGSTEFAAAYTDPVVAELWTGSKSMSSYSGAKVTFKAKGTAKTVKGSAWFIHYDKEWHLQSLWYDEPPNVTIIN